MGLGIQLALLEAGAVGGGGWGGGRGPGGQDRETLRARQGGLGLLQMPPRVGLAGHTPGVPPAGPGAVTTISTFPPKTYQLFSGKKMKKSISDQISMVFLVAALGEGE